MLPVLVLGLGAASACDSLLEVELPGQVTAEALYEPGQAPILVNSVAPGPMASETAKQTDWYGPMVAALPTRRPIEPAEVAAHVAHLASPANVSIAGENVVVSGGGVIV